MMEFLTQHPIPSGLIVAALVAAASFAARGVVRRRKARRIYAFLAHSAANTEFTFRSTRAISRETRIPSDQIEGLCLSHPKIRRNGKEKESWTAME